MTKRMLVIIVKKLVRNYSATNNVQKRMEWMYYNKKSQFKSYKK